MLLDQIFILKCELFYSLWIVFFETSRRFGFSTRSVGHVMFSFARTAHAQLHGSLMGRFFYVYGFLHFYFGSLWLSG